MASMPNVVYRVTTGTTDPEVMSHDLTDYKVILWATLGVGLIGLVLLVTWVFIYEGGVVWGSRQEFNWHVLAMTCGLVYFIALELMTFRALRYGQKKQLKLIHAGFSIPIIFMLIIGYRSILDVHYGRPNFYSFHSWMGILTTILYLSQEIFGCISYLWPGVEPRLRGAYMPYHVFFGLTTFVMGVATSLLGLFEEIKKIPIFTAEAIMMNLCGILIAVFTAMVLFLQTRPAFKRQPLPED